MVSRQSLSYNQAKEFITKQKSCNVISKSPIFRYDNFEYYTCSCTHSQSYLINWFSTYYAYKNGILPFVGGYYDQPALIEDIFSICQAYISKKEEEQLAKQKRK